MCPGSSVGSPTASDVTLPLILRPAKIDRAEDRRPAHLAGVEVRAVQNAPAPPSPYGCLNQIRLNSSGVKARICFGPKWGFGAVDILLLLGGLHLALIVAGWSSARSYFEKGRLHGMEEATREISRGISSHYEIEGQVVPERVAKAVKAVKAVSRKRWKKAKGSTDPYHARLWVVGDAIGEACWLKGHAAGIRRKAPAEGKIRVDLSLTELLQLSWLSHLGFQHMMPNYRGFEIHRFNGEEDAREGAKAVARIESVIPAKERPFADLSVQFKNRQKLICDWWQATPDRLTA